MMLGLEGPDTERSETSCSAAATAGWSRSSSVSSSSSCWIRLESAAEAGGGVLVHLMTPMNRMTPNMTFDCGLRDLWAGRQHRPGMKMLKLKYKISILFILCLIE